jgi:single-strand DNA-binding protein
MVQLQLIGALGKDATVNTTQNGKTVINFTVAVNTGYGENKTTLWVDCSKWGEKTGVADFLKKGTKVYVSGEPALKSYQKQDGTTGTSLSLTVANIELLGSKGDQPGQQLVPPARESDDNDGLPF